MPSKKSKPIKTQKGQNVLELTEDQARTHIEMLLWGDGEPVCPHCGSVNGYRMKGATCRPGLCRCRDCKKQFTVTVGTIFEDSHIPLAKWIRAIHMMASSKKGISALQLMRNLGIGSYRTAWFMAHRIRLAMKCEPMNGMLKGQVQIDETYVGGKPRPGDGKVHKRGAGTSKTPVVVLVETDGKAHSRPVEKVDSKTLRGALDEMVHPSAKIVTDELSSYSSATTGFAGHDSVNHSAGQYSKKKAYLGGIIETITTNTAESYFSLLKRGVYGTFHHVSKQHLHRYCNEFDFRWNGKDLEDSQRRDAAVVGARGKRLHYKNPVRN
jgi:transposase-like protein